MQKKVFSSNFMRIYFSEDTQILKIVWLDSSDEMTTEDFKEQIIGEKEAIVEFKPKAILADTLNFKYGIIPEIQDWHNQFLFPVFRSENVTELAIILSTDIFAQVSVDQLIADEENPNFITRYFDEEQAALDWLNN